MHFSHRLTCFFPVCVCLLFLVYTLAFVVSVFSLVVVEVFWPLASVVHALPCVDLALSGEKGLALGQVLESVLHRAPVHLHAQVIEGGGHQPLLHLSDGLKLTFNGAFL